MSEYEIALLLWGLFGMVVLISIGIWSIVLNR